MNVMLLAAGEGTRLRPHTEKLPKPAISFLNVPLFLYSLHFVRELGISKVVMNTFHLPQKLKETVNKYKSQYPIHFSDESVLLGSGGGLGKAREYFQDQDHLVLMNGDELIIPNKKNQVKEAFEFHKKSGNIATLLVTDHHEVGKKFGGVWTDTNKKVLGFGKQQVSGSVKGYHYTGVCFFSKKIFNYIPEGVSNILYDNVMQALADQNKAQVYELSCSWHETGNEIDFKAATADCLNQIKDNTEEGKYLLEIIKQYAVNSEIIFDAEKVLLYDKSAKFNLKNIKGVCVLGKNVEVSPTAMIENTILGDGVKIFENTAIKNLMLIS
jgi:mannose-1-phosphate guanylyltransferase